MQNFDGRIIMDLITHLPTEDVRQLTAFSFNYLAERERSDKERLLLENQNLHYKNICRMEALEENGIADPFDCPCDEEQETYI